MGCLSTFFLFSISVNKTLLFLFDGKTAGLGGGGDVRGGFRPRNFSEDLLVLWGEL